MNTSVQDSIDIVFTFSFDLHKILLQANITSIKYNLINTEPLFESEYLRG